jgi:hypothetical protein
MTVVVQNIGDQTFKNTGTSLAVDAPSNISVGDLLLMHFVNSGLETIDTPSGWTAGPTNSISAVRSAIFWKNAEAGDVGASTFTVTTQSGGSNARCFRITGHDPVTPIVASNTGTGSSTSITVAGITPTRVNSLVMILVADDSDAAVTTCASYALATSSPAFTEHYDEQWDSSAGHMSAVSGLRPEVTATGNATATLSISNPYVGILLAIQPPITNITVTPTVLSSTFTLVTPSISANSNVTISLAVNSTFTINAPTVTISTNPWTNPDKSSLSSPTNTPKSTT